MTATSPITLSSKTVTTTAGVTHIDLNFSAAMAKGRGSIFVTDGAVQTVIDRVTGEPKLRVVGATFTKEVPLSQVTVEGSHVSFDAAGLAAGKHYSIFMGAGTLTSGGSPFAGYTMPGDLTFTMPSLPALEASIAFHGTTLTASGDIQATVTFTKAVSELLPGAVSTEHAGIKSITKVGDGLSWNIVLTANGSVESASNFLRLDLTKVLGADGTHGAGMTVSQPYAVDTKPPVVTASPDGVADFPLDADIVVTFDQAVYWRAEDGNADTLYLHGSDGAHIAIDLDTSNFSENGLILTVPAAGHGLLPGVEYSLVLPENLVDAAGNPVFGYEIQFATAGDAGGSDDDHVAPRAILVTVVDGDGHYTVNDQIVFRVLFDEPIRKIDDSYPSLRLSNGGSAEFTGIEGNAAYFSYIVQEGDDDDNVTISDASELNGHFADMSAYENLLDAAHIEYLDLEDGHGYGALIDVDTQAPLVLEAPLLAPGSDSGMPGDGLTNTTTPMLTGTGAEAWATIRIYDGAILLGTGEADGDGIWQAWVSEDAALSERAHSLTVRQEDAAGNRSPASAALEITIDTTVEKLSALRLLNDTGSSASDHATSDSTLKGGGAEAGAHIKIMRGDEVVGTGTADDAGNWTAIFGAPLPDGPHTVTVRQIDRAGNISEDSAPITFTMQPAEVIVVAAAPRLAAASDTGLSSSDGITRDATPTFTGSAAAPNSTIALFAGSREIGRAATDASGNWSVNVSDANKFTADGSYAITSRPVSGAGVLGTASESTQLVIDTTAPRLTAFHILFKRFELEFGEKVVFDADGEFKLVKNEQEREIFKGNDPVNWHIADSDGKHMLTLSFGMNGTLHLSMQNENGVQDVAGNAAVIVGSPAWMVDFFI